jgi:uncharacterized protein
MSRILHTPAFQPPLALRHKHVQSILASAAQRIPLLRSNAAAVLDVARPEVLDCGAGVRLQGFHSSHARAAAGSSHTGSRGLVILLHGWEGSAQSHYIISAASKAYDAGYDVFRLNFRDHGDTHALNEELFHSCRLDEVIGAIQRISLQYPSARTFLVGYSLGGNFALRVAARAEHARLELAKVIAVCPVLRPHSTMRALESGLWIYREYFLRRWRRSLMAKAAMFPALYDFGDLTRLPTLTATTAYFVERHTEFADLDSYLRGYEITGDALGNLKVPTWIIATHDDPVIPSADLRELAHSGALQLTLAPRGGHCGFIENFRLGSWVDRCLQAEFEAL